LGLVALLELDIDEMKHGITSDIIKENAGKTSHILKVERRKTPLFAGF
jgi:hypothetical protein